MKQLMSGLRLTVGLVMLVFAWGCSKDSDSNPQPDPGPTPGGNSANVVMENFTYSPGTLTIARGTTVTWTNRDYDTHTVTADDNSFNSPGITPGGTYSRTFTAADTITYHCIPHPQMQGTIIVQ